MDSFLFQNLCSVRHDKYKMNDLTTITFGHPGLIHFILNERNLLKFKCFLEIRYLVQLKYFKKFYLMKDLILSMKI